MITASIVLTTAEKKSTIEVTSNSVLQLCWGLYRCPARVVIGKKGEIREYRLILRYSRGFLENRWVRMRKIQTRNPQHCKQQYMPIQYWASCCDIKISYSHFHSDRCGTISVERQLQVDWSLWIANATTSFVKKKLRKYFEVGTWTKGYASIAVLPYLKKTNGNRFGSDEWRCLSVY